MKPVTLRILLGGLLLLAIGVAIALREQFDAAALQHWVEDAGATGAVLFVLGYALASVLFLPGSVLTLAGGALFGPLWGTLLNLAGATLGATLAFLIARYLGADWVAARAGPRLQQINDGVSREGWRFVAFVRLVPLFPFNLLNYALGLSRIRLLTYIVASAVFMLPGAFAYTWLGHTGRSAFSGEDGMLRNILIALALLAAVGFLPRLLRTLRHAPMLDVTELRQALAQDSDTLVVDVRSAAEFDGELGHIDGARNLPLDQLPQRMCELEAYRQRPLRLICHTDHRSGSAAQLLRDAGFSDVRVVKGGMLAWVKGKLP